MVVAEGTPEDVAADPSSFTGQFLVPLLQGGRAAIAAPAGKAPARTAAAKKAPAKKATAKRATPRRTPAKKASR